MKKILGIFWLLGLIILNSCEKDEIRVTLKDDPTPAGISSHADGFAKVITNDNLQEDFEITWTPADYGVTSPVTYTVELDSAGKSFENAVALGSTTEDFLSMSLGDLNSKLLQDLNIPSKKEATLELRIVSSLNGQQIETSPAISIKLTPVTLFDPANPPALWVPGGYQGWNPGQAPKIYGVSDTEFEGYVYIQEGTGFKFTSDPDWDHINYGDSGTPGQLTTDGLAPGLSASDAGYYRFKVNIEALTYEMYRVESFGMIGTATPGAWDSSTPMDYDPVNGVWKKTLDLASGALKFRANNDWWLNYGPEDSNALNGYLTQTDAAISINEPGNYTVTLNFKRETGPRKYSYTVVKNGDTPAVTQLWVPGEYQGWSPSSAPTIYSTSATTYEGYVYMNVGAGFKFTSSADWDHTNYGDSGTPGMLSTDGLAGNLSVSEAGYYRFKIDVANLTYEFYKVASFGVIGTATPGGWDNSTEMTFDEETGLWSVTLDLVGGALKFRANNSWDLNYGPADSNALTGKLIQTDAAITIPEAGNYTVTIDMSRSNEAHEYLYTVTKN
jgi:starch-binding outer membrane protein SusE/F